MAQKKIEAPGGFVLTKKTASALAKELLGTDKGLAQIPNMPKGWFEITLGKLEAWFSPDTNFNSGRVTVLISLDGTAAGGRRFYDRDTLQEDDSLFYRWKEMTEREMLETWVNEDGPQRCHERIDQIAARDRLRHLNKSICGR